ncbi:hypothetical protein K1719_027932 [Acacia pycnantha]|nr:hypothetical protein K1719_027932 [Acacia pycnantha]
MSSLTNGGGKGDGDAINQARVITFSVREVRDRALVWTSEEETVLVELLVDRQNGGKNLRKSSFLPGDLMNLEKKIEERLSGCGLKGNSDIHTRIRRLKDDWMIVCKMLMGKMRMDLYETVWVNV